jgi:hypothetical protein
MTYTFHLLKAVSLLFLSAGCFGCTTLQAVPGVSDVTGAVDTGINEVKKFVASKTGQDSKGDKYCDLFEEPSYALTDNVMQVASAAGFKSLEDWSKHSFKGSPTDHTDLEETVKTVSKNYVWMPVSFEQSLGNALHARLKKDGNLLDRQGRRNQKLYNKADMALKNAAKDYTKLPYETKLYIIDSDQINAEALPAGYIYVTRQAANDLDDNALQLVLGHEMAHIAKRHTSKQIQQRLVDTGVATEMFRRILEHRSMNVIDKFFTGEKVIASFNNQFAKYDQGQELQADACSVRGMLSAGADPLQARAEYLRIRGTKEEKSGPAPAQSARPFGLGFTEHPDDKDRDRFFREAYQYHRQKNQAACAGLPSGCSRHWRAA